MGCGFGKTAGILESANHRETEPRRESLKTAIVKPSQKNAVITENTTGEASTNNNSNRASSSRDTEPKAKLQKAPSKSVRFVEEIVDIDGERSFTIIHFNDVYNIESREKEPVGGAARFKYKLNTMKHLNPLVFFSGDCLNPSMMSSVTRGKQMIPILNSLGVNAAVYGNHDFDFGVDELLEFSEATKFPWFMSNVVDKKTNKSLAEGLITKLIVWQGVKIGLMGLVEQEWLVTLATIDCKDLEYLDFVEEGNKLAKELKKMGADFIIALTHMRMPNDIKLAENVSSIDLILGGHDHHYEVKEVNGTKIIKSGTDFRQMSKLTIQMNQDRIFSINVQRINITAEIPEEPELKEIVDSYTDIVKEGMQEILGDIDVELDGRFASIRTRETNLGNFVADIMRSATRSDIALLNAGTLRSDSVHGPGEFKVKDLVAILPMPDSLVVLSVTGQTILDALENGVSQWPKKEGRFPQVSGISYAFDASVKPPDKRIIKDSVKVGGEPLELEKEYSLCLKEYLSKGRDGYDMFKNSKVLVDIERGPILPSIVQNHFTSVKIFRGLKGSRSGHRQSLVAINIGEFKEEFENAEKEKSRLHPKVEGRITIIGAELENVDLHDSNALVGTEASSMVKYSNPTEQNGIPVLQENKETEENCKEVELPPDLATEDDYWDLWEAVKSDNIDKVQQLHREKSIRLTRFQDNKTVLHLAAERNSVKIIKYLLDDGKVDPNIKDEIIGGFPLHGAAECGSIEAARELLDHGAEINKQDLIGNTALHIAAEHEQNDMVKFLLQKGADSNILNSDGKKASIEKVLEDNIVAE